MQSLGTAFRLHVPGDCDSHVERIEDQVLWPWEPWEAKVTVWHLMVLSLGPSKISAEAKVLSVIII